jgi:3-hydroxyisobutyrate dehydrogenase-like beta-hydroxyacid dehydrogenase
LPVDLQLGRPRSAGHPTWCNAASDPGFRCDLHYKDLGILTSAARDAGVVIPLAVVAAQLLASLVAQGQGHGDSTTPHR